MQTTYYCTLLRDAGSDTIDVKIYTNVARTTLLTTLTLTGFGTGTKYRYLYGFLNRNNGSGANWDGWIENMRDESSV